MGKARFNPMRPRPTIGDFFSNVFLATMTLSCFGCLSVLGIINLSENDPRKKHGPLLRRNVEDSSENVHHDWDWEQAKLEWFHVLHGVKIRGKYVFLPKPGEPTLEDYLKEKDARLRAEQSKDAEPK
ncbi:hypothetical protein MHU86_20901 [Fragilaria crotonensis]|nr:hypothetical protein MHU86_20901 [Fragilaria crotonensis]